VKDKTRKSVQNEKRRKMRFVSETTANDVQRVSVFSLTSHTLKWDGVAVAGFKQGKPV